jgi:hypothetical protein
VGARLVDAGRLRVTVVVGTPHRPISLPSLDD